jgi:hypothetical protein
MKKINNIIIGFIVLTCVACSEDLLDKDPVSSFSAQGFYQNASDAQAGIYGTYDALQSVMRVNFAYWGEGRADAVSTIQAGDPGLLQQNNLTPIMSSASWNNIYEMISRANYAIRYIPDVFEEGSPLGGELMGQARALRALGYFYAVRIWGDVPLILEPYQSIDQEIFIEKTNESQIMDQIIEDLQFAAENCRASYGGERDRILITQGAAQGFLTQVYMWRGDYSNAIVSANQVIDNPLYNLVSMRDWSSIFTAGLSSESIFEVGYNEIQTNALRVLYALGSDSNYFPSEKFRNSFEAEDQRRQKIYDTTQVEPSMIWKYFGEGFNDESPDPSANNIVLLRLADILLLKAEAHAQLGEDDEALDMLNSIRNRAGLESLDQVDAQNQYGSILEAIYQERYIELSFEGHRWFDLVRTERAIEVMQPLNGLSDPANLVWPIQEDAINRNPNLEQNAFYQ